MNPWISLSLCLALSTSAFGQVSERSGTTRVPGGKAAIQKSVSSKPIPAGKSTAPFSAEAVRTADSVIREDALRNYLTFIASDALAGRDTPSQGLDVAAEFLAFHLRAWGYRPAGDNGTFFQKIALLRSRIDRESLSATMGGSTLEPGKDWFVGMTPGGGNGKGTADGACVYVGHGWQAKGRGVDPYAGLDVRGKILLINGAQPEGFAPDNTPGKEVLPPALVASRLGAVGIVELNTGDNEAFLRRGRSREAMGERRGMTPVAPDEVKEGVPVISLSPAQSGMLLDGSSVAIATVADEAAKRATAKGVVLPDSKRIRFTVGRQTSLQWTRNVVAVWPGSDPKLRAEHVAIGAHYDHVGVRTGGPEGSDRIYNGADDDGSGTVGVLSIAEAIARGPKPKRSVLLVWHAGEEKGLWGSEFFVNHPTVPLNSIVAQLNIDMIGRSKRAGDTDRRNAELSGPNGIYVIGSRMLSTQLGDLSEAVNNSYLKLKFDYRYDDPKDPNRFYFRSDHYNYARKNIPIIFYFDGVHEDYHQVSDEVEKIDFAKMGKVTKTIYMTLMALADRAQRPVVDGTNNR